MKSLETAISGISVLSAEGMNIFLDAWQHWSVGRDHTLLREHAVADYIYYIHKGMARIYYRKGGKEITEWIAPQGTFLLSITSFFRRVPGKLVIHTLEASEVMGIHYNDLNRLAAEHHEIETLYRKMLSGSLILSQLRMESIQFETAEQRYKKLIGQHPEFIQKVPLSYLASFLGVTPETLSRIRASAFL